MKHVQMQLDGSGGFFKVIAGTERSQVAAMTLPKGESTGGPNNKHTSSDQWLYVISGAGEAVVAGKRWTSRRVASYSSRRARRMRSRILGMDRCKP